jgi:hypothetical protein
MTDKRHFYTDPLAVLWMAKHFGMRFVEEYDADVEIKNLHSWSLSKAQPDRFYIHPDSLQLLKSRSGDLARVRWIPGVPDSAEVYFPIYIDETKHDVLAIVLRDGVHFIWPESEAA